MWIYKAHNVSKEAESEAPLNLESLELRRLRADLQLTYKNTVSPIVS